MASAQDVVVPFIRKKGRSRPTTTRQRSASPGPAETSSTTTTGPSKSEVVLPARKNASRLISAGTKRTVSKRDEDEAEEEERDGPGVKWTTEGSHINAAKAILLGDEADEVLAKRRKAENADGDDDDGPEDGLYRGQKGYTNHLKRRQEVPKAMRVGPQRNTSTIRTVTIVDYQPDVCKDYKETGYCGFGDTCKFLHDRGTYLAGWQLDKLAETAQREAKDVEDSDSEEDVPFACLICRKHFTNPVVTRCGHYFCSDCAIKRFGKTPKCIACGAQTGGIFNRADKILEKMNKKKSKKVDEDGMELDQGPDRVDGGVTIEGLSGADSDGEND
ncbi:hypothetical protein BJ322DRAFT_1097997 [Thelephora terrestris]|uniref:Pre-mRNA-splicing factor CWC24 n=1 Tax=Thelephora terrestris TaxID=56493 RepID=A0A9P6HRA6_9AGAM|nr:hypothetical protein BJ322DRAFT_1097997 [Thelephora terrestris]